MILFKSVYVLKQEIIAAGKKMYDRGYVASNDGNISARLDERSIIITASGISKGSITPEDLIIVDLNGKVLTGSKKPSTEMQMHLMVYRERPDIHAVCHAHPPYATGFAVAGIQLDKPVLSEVILSLGYVPVVPYATTGTNEVTVSLQPYINKYDAFLLANHGALTIGNTVLSAYNKLETVEHAAHIIFIAGQLGNVNTLSTEQVEKLLEQRKNFGIRKDLGM